jgi:hypothetical protein
MACAPEKILMVEPPSMVLGRRRRRVVMDAVYKQTDGGMSIDCSGFTPRFGVWEESRPETTAQPTETDMPARAMCFAPRSPSNAVLASYRSMLHSTSAYSLYTCRPLQWSSGKKKGERPEIGDRTRSRKC